MFELSIFILLVVLFLCRYYDNQLHLVRMHLINQPFCNNLFNTSYQHILHISLSFIALTLIYMIITPLRSNYLTH